MKTAQERRIGLALEKLEKLTGERAKGAQRALLYSDLALLRRIVIPDITASAAAGDPPTKAEFDALVEDVRILRRAIVAIISGL